MPDIQQRIAEILDTRLDLYVPSAERAELAEVLVAELGLVREWTGHARIRDAGVRRAEHYEVPLKVRYVTDWMPEPGAAPATRSLPVRKAAAQVALAASRKTGRPVDPRVQKLADGSTRTGTATKTPCTTKTSGDGLKPLRFVVFLLKHLRFTNSRCYVCTYWAKGQVK